MIEKWNTNAAERTAKSVLTGKINVHALRYPATVVIALEIAAGKGMTGKSPIKKARTA